MSRNLHGFGFNNHCNNNTNNNANNNNNDFMNTSSAGGASNISNTNNNQSSSTSRLFSNFTTNLSNRVLSSSSRDLNFDNNRRNQQPQSMSTRPRDHQMTMDNDIVMGMEEENDIDDSSTDEDEDDVDIVEDMTGIISRVSAHSTGPEPAPSGTNASIVDIFENNNGFSENQSMDATTSQNTAATDVAPSATNIAPNIKENPESEKRREIQAILRDTTLSHVEKNLCIQKLMDGRKKKKETKPTTKARSGTSASSEDDISAIISGINCVHYDRKCVVVSPCCNKIYGCRICHDESISSYDNSSASVSGISHVGANGMNRSGVCTKTMDRFAIKEIICRECHTRQPCANKCINCNIQFAEYHCAKCNLWMSNTKRPFHCDQCGFCRVGGREAFKHCNICNMCISTTVYNTHNCMKDKYKNNCPVCTEDMFSSRQAPQDLPCGHAIHAHCFRKLAGFDYRCPVCKKTVVSRASMAAAWSARARDIAMQPMPPDLARRVCIMCNDCEVRSDDCSFHFLGVQCPKCDSFNTQQLSSTSAVIDMDDEDSNQEESGGGNDGNEESGDGRPQFSDMAPNI